MRTSRLLFALLFTLFLFPAVIQAQIKVTVAGQGPVIAGPTLICKGSETLLKVEGDYESFSWNTGSTERFIKVREEGIYEVTVKTKGGCTLTSSVNVKVQSCTR